MSPREGIRCVESEEFIHEVAHATKQGFGFTVLFGSGMSAPAGIIMGMQFSGYLAYCVYRAVNDDFEEYWDFRNNNWPPYPSTSDYVRALQWVQQEFVELCRQSGYRVEMDPRGLVYKIDVDPSQPTSAFAALNCPPVPSAIRSPEYFGDEAHASRMAQTLRQSMKGNLPYEPLWPRLEVSPSSRSHLVELAIRSLADWRSSLHFLSRVVKRPNRVPWLQDPDEQVTDRFNSFITADKQPALGHKMLVHLSRPLRIRTILTTNFDTLIEDAYAQTGITLKKIPVSKEGHLPDPFEVGAHVSIIKMHGEVAETRADMSLDEEPNEEDKRRFLGYFVDIDENTQNHKHVPSHLLVAGFSASDLRIVRFIQHLLDSTRDLRTELQPKVFWICFTQSDVARISHFLPANEYHSRVLVHQSVRPDLLLHELYQKVTLSLPPGGLTYEYSHNVPPNRYGSERFNDSPKGELDTVFANLAPNIEKVLREGGEPNDEDKKRARDQLSTIVGLSLAELMSKDANKRRAVSEEVSSLYGVSKGSAIRGSDGRAAVAPAFSLNKLSKEQSQEIITFDMSFGVLEAFSIPHHWFLSKVGRQCLWFELADYLDADSLLRDILRAIALRIGRYQREQVTLHPLRKRLGQDDEHGMSPADPNTQCEELCAHLQSMCATYHLTAADWSLLFYGREVAGSCVGWLGSPWSDNDWKNLSTVLRAFSAVGFHVVFSIPSQNRIERENEKWRDFAPSAVPAAEDAQTEHQRFLQAVDRPPFRLDFTGKAPYSCGITGDGGKLSLFKSMIAKIDNACQKSSRFADFFYAVTLFRQSRRPTALFYEAVQPCPFRFNLCGIDNDLIRSNEASAWTRELRAARIFYNKPGGHAWMHRDLRLIARARLDRAPLQPSVDGTTRFRGQNLARQHFWIGDWYFKAFCSTGFVLPIIECLHHRFQAALTAPYAYPKNERSAATPLSTPSNVSHYRFSLFRSAILEIRKTLLVAHPYLKLWLANEHGFPMFKENGAIHNSEPDTIAGLLRDAARKLNVCNPRLEELHAEIKLLETEIIAIDRSICEEADINRAALSYHDSRKRSKVFDGFDADVREWTSHVYLNDFDETPVEEAIFKVLSSGDLSQEVAAAAKEQVCKLINLGGSGRSASIEEYAQIKAECLARLGPHFQLLWPLLVVFEALAYIRLRRAKFKVHSDRHDSNESWRQPEVRLAWLRVSQICNLAIDWCKHLPVELLTSEMDLKVRLHSYYSIALANLDRFYEAHRHINEASGIHSKSASASPQLGVTKLHLRRAEVFLTEAHRIRCVLHDPAIVGPDEPSTVDVRALLRSRWQLDVTSFDAAEISAKQPRSSTNAAEDCDLQNPSQRREGVGESQCEKHQSGDCDVDRVLGVS